MFLGVHGAINFTFSDKNSLLGKLGKLNMRKTELKVKKKNHKIWSTFFRRQGKSVTRSYSEDSGI
jgi:hypothetical protein